MTIGTPSFNAYIELLKTFPPRPITSEKELTATQKVIDSLIDKGELTPDEQDYSSPKSFVKNQIPDFLEKSGIWCFSIFINQIGLLYLNVLGTLVYEYE